MAVITAPSTITTNASALLPTVKTIGSGHSAHRTYHLGQITVAVGDAGQITGPGSIDLWYCATDNVILCDNT